MLYLAQKLDKGGVDMSAIHLNKETFAQLLSGERPALVEFWAPWCGHCRDLEGAFNQITEDYKDRLAIGKINIDDYPQLTQQYYIEYVPTLVLFSEGSVVDFVISPGTKEAIAQFIEETLE